MLSAEMKDKTKGRRDRGATWEVLAGKASFTKKEVENQDINGVVIFQLMLTAQSKQWQIKMVGSWRQMLFQG